MIEEEEFKTNVPEAEKENFMCVYPEEKVKEFVKKLKEEWKLKMRRMEVISVEVAIYELNQLADSIFGSELI